jgi:serine/threonine-protein kinase
MPSLTPESHSKLLSALRADQSACWQRGERVRVEDYLGRHPDLASDPEAVLELVYGEVLLRLDDGEAPALQEYLHRFVGHSAALRGRWVRFRLLHPELPPEASEAASTVSEGRALPPAPALALPGFEIHERLGEGGMGVVFKAREIDLDRVVALKVIRAGPLAGPALLSRFRTEERAVARLDHPGVVRIFSSGQHEGWVYFCMEFVPGGSLAARLRGGPLGIREAAELVRQLALAVQHAHERGVLHRDLKPANVLLAADGAAKVGDFGLAKLLDADDGMTWTGVVMGTPSYMAPEQAHGRTRDVGPAADVWALGVILYECLTGKVPFKGEGRSETLERVKSQPPPPPSGLRPETPPELEAVCLKCLEKDPARRYPCAAALAEDLRLWAEGRRPSAFAGRGRKGVRARWGVLVGCAALGLLLPAAWIISRPAKQPRTATLGERLARGERVVLVDAERGLAGREPQVGSATSKVSRAEDGAATLDSWSLCLLELASDPGVDRYRVLARLRHDQTLRLGEVGLYASHRVLAGGPAPLHSFIALSWNDVAQPPLPTRAGKPGGERGLRPRLYADGPEGKGWNQAGGGPVVPFQPAGGSGGRWRDVVLEVTPEKLRGGWQTDENRNELADRRVRDSQNGMLNLMRHLRPKEPAPVGFRPGILPRGGVGLYVYRALVSVERVVIEPVVPNR